MMVIMDEANRTPRCTERGCPVRYAAGTDRPCRGHRGDGDTLAARMEEFAAMSAPPGEHDGQADEQQAAGQAVNRHGATIRRPPADLP